MNTYKCIKKHQLLLLSLFCLLTALLPVRIFADDNVIEKQLEEIGTIPNDDIIVVQRKYTRKNWRHELTPITLGGIPFGTIRRTLFAGASYTLHANDWLAIEPINFLYGKNFFSSFTDDINANKDPLVNPSQNDIKPDVQRLVFLLTGGLQFTPFYGKISTYSRWLAYLEPFFSIGAGLAKTETSSYFTFYPGVGFRVYFKEWFSMKIELRNYMYQEVNPLRDGSGGTKVDWRSNYAATIALSFWLPKMDR